MKTLLPRFLFAGGLLLATTGLHAGNTVAELKAATADIKSEKDRLAVQSALPLSFDPRYRDFPFAPLTAAALPFVLLPRGAGLRPLAETIAAATLLPCALFIVWNESLANWQALWFAAALALVAFSLLRARAAPG